MEELGRKFKNRRQELEIELTTAREETNIRLDYLKAIEEGNFDRIEEEVYLKGFLKVYSSYLDLETKEIMEEYKQLKLAEEEEAGVEGEEETKTVEKVVKQFVDKHQNSLLGLVIGGLIFLLVVAGIYLGTVAYQQFKKHNTGQKVKEYISELTGAASQEQEESAPQDAESSPPESAQTEETNQNTKAGETNQTQLSSTTEDQEQAETEAKSNQEGTNSEAKEQESVSQNSSQTDEEQAKNSQVESKTTIEQKASTEAESKDNQPPKEDSTTEAGTEANANQSTADRESGTASKPNKVKPTPEKPESQANEEPANQEQAPGETSQGKLTIQVKTIEESWYLIKVDGKTIFRGLVAQGTIKQFSGQEIKVRIGNAAGVQIIKGNQTLGPFGKKGEIVTKVFTEQMTDQQE